MIRIDRTASDYQLAELDVDSWPVWEHGLAVFPWHYDSTETCYLTTGHVIVTPDGGDPVELRAGDLVTLPAGLSCTWDIRRPVRKHYAFD